MKTTRIMAVALLIVASGSTFVVGITLAAQDCHACHTIVRDSDFVFTKYAQR